MLRFLLINKIIVSTLALLGAIVLFFGYSSSLWFLKGLWGTAPASMEFGYQNTAASLTFFADQGKEIGTTIYNKLGFDQKLFWRIAYIQDASGEYITLIPSVLGQGRAKASLRAAGWTVHRFGWFLVATRTTKNTRTYNLVSGIAEEAKAAFTHKLPISPLVFFRTQKANRGSIAIYASNEQNGIHGTASIDSFDFIASTQKEDIQQEIPEGNNLIVSLPRDVLASMNDDFLGSIETVIAQLLHFQKTTPDIISKLPNGGDMYMVIDNKDIGLGILSQGDVLADNVVAFMATEQGQRHPKKKAFILPDGSLGYEYVGGIANPRFVSNGSSTDCLPSTGYDETLFLCGKKEAAVVASTEDIGRQLLDFMTGASTKTWRGYISGKYPLYFTGKDKAIDFFIPQNR